LTAVHFADRPGYCGGISSCETVNTSRYAEVGGVPVALLGLAGYALMMALVLVRGRRWWADPALLMVAATALLYSGYLTWVELHILHAVCVWCATSAVVVALITAAATLLVLAPPDGNAAEPAPVALRG
jgi:uncharacterized membrane protein